MEVVYTRHANIAHSSAGAVIGYISCQTCVTNPDRPKTSDFSDLDGCCEPTEVSLIRVFPCQVLAMCMIGIHAGFVSEGVIKVHVKARGKLNYNLIKIKILAHVDMML